jgi:leucine dehydrogenase
MSTVAAPRSKTRASGAALPRRESQPEVAPVPLEHEDLVVHRGSRSGSYVIVAIHSTALGPALGGVRLWHYPATTDAVRDALRLARGMTFKAAAAGLALGGGKGVICGPPHAPTGSERCDLLRDFGDLVESLDGRYVTAEDVAISPPDLVVIRERTAHVTGLPPDRGGSGDPSPFTALGVEAAMKACARVRFASPELAGLRIVVAGLGHVGEKLARRLTEHGAQVAVSDIDPKKRRIAEKLGARWIEPDEEMIAECDILAPCALGGAIDAGNLSLLHCEIVCGCANNQLADESLAEALAARGILYGPDFVVNAGGLIHVYKEIRGYSEGHARELVLGIQQNLEGILRTAEARGITPLDAARAVALERLEVADAGRSAAA